MRILLRILGLDDASRAELRASLWTAAMFCACLASTFLLRPVREQFGVDQGVEQMPRLYGITLLMTCVFAPAFWRLADRMPSRRFVPISLHCLAASMLVVFAGLWIVGPYDWRSGAARSVGEGFWGFFSAFNLAVPTLVWVHAVENFDKRQALRLFGLVGVGGTAGAAMGSWLARFVADAGVLPAWSAIGSLALLEIACVCHAFSSHACFEMRADRGETVPDDAVSRGGILAGFSALRRSGHLRTIAGYMMLLAMTASAFAFFRTRMLAEQVGGGRAQHGWLANQEFLSQSLVLLLQLFLSARLLRRLPPVFFLAASPLLSAVGLCVVWHWPSVAALAAVMIALRGVQFALEKPSREALYTPLDLETKHKAKFLLDTVALRFGDWLGACAQVWIAGAWGNGVDAAMAAAVCIALLWGCFGVHIGTKAH